MDQQRLRTLRIVEKRAMTRNTFFIKLEADADLEPARVSYCVYIHDDAGNYAPYSPLYTTKKNMAFGIKVYPQGKMSVYICKKDVGDTLQISEALNKRESKLNEFKNVLMIAGGTGATPMYQMLREHILSGLNRTDYTLLFLNDTENDVLLNSEFESLKKKSNGKLQIIHVFSEGTAVPDSWHMSGTLNKDMLLTLTRSKMFEFVYICGPPRLLADFSGPKMSRTEQGELTGVLREIGYNEKNVYKF